MSRAMRRKQVTMLVTVSVPAGTTAAHARREVRSLVSDQCTYALDYEDIRCISVKPIQMGGK